MTDGSFSTDWADLVSLWMSGLPQKRPWRQQATDRRLVEASPRIVIQPSDRDSSPESEGSHHALRSPTDYERTSIKPMLPNKPRGVSLMASSGSYDLAHHGLPIAANFPRPRRKASGTLVHEWAPHASAATWPIGWQGRVSFVRGQFRCQFCRASLNLGDPSHQRVDASFERERVYQSRHRSKPFDNWMNSFWRFRRHRLHGPPWSIGGLCHRATRLTF